MRSAAATALTGVLLSCGGPPRDARTPTAFASVETSRDADPALSRTMSPHATIVDRLTNAKTSFRPHEGIAIPLPDASGWDSVDLWLVPSVMSVQYGDASDFHAILAAFLVSVPDADEPGACDRAFLPWAGRWLDAFDAEARREKGWTGEWSRSVFSPAGQYVGEERVPIQGAAIFGRVATLLLHGTFSSAYAVYPAWKATCLAVGLAIPNRDHAEPQARALRDRFLREILPNVRVFLRTPPEEARR
jgi:hypothetical protein